MSTIEKNIRTVTVHPVIDGDKHRLVAHYGINQVHDQRPYFSVTGELYEPSGGRFGKEPDLCGKIHDLLVEHMPWLRQLVELHLADAETGEPMYAVSNAWHWYSIEKAVRRGQAVSMPKAYPALDPAQRAAAYLGCDPAVFDQVTVGEPEQARARFEAAVDTLRPLWSQRAALVRQMYRLEPETAAPTRPYSVNLDAESVRGEIEDAYLHADNPRGHTLDELQALLALDDRTIGEAIAATVDDSFWYAFDSIRSDVISRLTSELGDAGE